MAKKAVYELPPDWDKTPETPIDTLNKIYRNRFTHYIFYKKYSGRVEWCCSHCGAHSVKYPRSASEEMSGMADSGSYQRFRDNCSEGSAMLCPECGVFCDAKPIGRNRTRLRERAAYAVLIREGDIIYINVHSFYVIYGNTGEFDGESCATYLDYKFKLDTVAHKANGAERLAYGGWFDFNDYKEPYAGCQNFDAEIYNRDVIAGTALAYCPPVKNYHPIKFLQLLCVYPNIERLAKFKLTGVLSEIIDMREPFKRAIDFDAKTPWAMLKLTKQEYTELGGVKRPGSMFLESIKKYRIIKRDNPEVTVADAAQFMDLCDYTGSHACDYALKFLTIHKFLKYLNSQRRVRLGCGCMQAMGREYDETINQAFYNYRDYINDCKTLNYDLTDRQIVLPSSLESAHQRTIDALQALRMERDIEQRERRIKDCDGLIAKYKARQKQLTKWYSFTDGKYFIKIPSGAREIVEEGAKMGHCVGGYAKRHMEGTTTILFMRRCDNPDKPLYTIEINDKDFTVVQIRAERNGPVKAGADMAFYEAFCTQMQNKARSKKQKAAKTA